MIPSILNTDLNVLIEARRARLGELTLTQAEQDAKRVQKQKPCKRAAAKGWYATQLLDPGATWYGIQVLCQTNADAAPKQKPLAACRIWQPRATRQWICMR